MIYCKHVSYIPQDPHISSYTE